ncbi:MAG TPA: HAMP domain-containing protein [Anaerolineaceae bacterium]|nr:HAMP domain-containing protein [Anaerolineaceae bacterium]HPN53798.1 HAMP domain-containing protein [Anaerolineaceae bacterium]
MAQPQPSPKTFKMSLRIKLLVGFTLLFTAVYAVTFYWFYNFSTLTAKSRIETDLLETLNGAIQGIDGDEFALMVKEAQPDETGLPANDPLYQKHMAWMDTIRRLEPRATPYTYVPGSAPDEVLFVGDFLRISQPDRSTSWLEPYPGVVDMPEGFKRQFFKDEIYTDEWGSWISGYGPIKNAKGEVVGGLGIDFEAAYVYQVQKSILDSMLLAFIITYAVLFLLVYFVSQFFTRSIVRLTQVAERIGEGDYNQDLTSLTKGFLRDEINIMAEVFAVMVSKVYKREQTLRNQVEQLKIEIDEAKRQSQVSEIVDTDFFRDLQSKASKLRQRRGRNSVETPPST